MNDIREGAGIVQGANLTCEANQHLGHFWADSYDDRLCAKELGGLSRPHKRLGNDQWNARDIENERPGMAGCDRLERS